MIRNRFCQFEIDYERGYNLFGDFIVGSIFDICNFLGL